MLPLRERIFPDVDCEIEGDTIWMRSAVRKKADDGKYYLTEIKRQIKLTNDMEQHRKVIIHQLVNQFNYMVYMFLMFVTVIPDKKNRDGNSIFVEDPDQTDDLLRVYKVFT